MNDALIYLDTYVLQQDMRVRMPKTILANLNLEKGVYEKLLEEPDVEVKGTV